MTWVLDNGQELVLIGLAGFCLLLGRLVPRLCLVLWAAVLTLVPYWFALESVLILPYSLLATAAVIVVTARKNFAPRPMDVTIALFTLLLIIAVLPGVGRPEEVIAFVAGPLVAYVAGRTVLMAVPLDLLYKVLGSFFVIVAVLAIVESISGVNPLLELGPSNSLANTWAEPLMRGGQLRPEVSFGSPIAMGASLAMTIPLIWMSRWPGWWRSIAIVLVSVGALASLSRIAMVTAFLSIVVMAVFSPRRMTLVQGLLTVVLAMPAVLIAFEMVRGVFQDAGSEATDSAEYRAGLWELIPSMQGLGFADSITVRADGAVYSGGFRSIDSQIILMGLRHGLFPLALLLAALAVGAILVLRGRASAPLIAVVCQLPALAGVALITQYGIYFWFLVGLAATVPTVRREIPRIRAAWTGGYRHVAEDILVQVPDIVGRSAQHERYPLNTRLEDTK